MSDELQKFRSRWKRWLGQKTRVDKSNWVTLLDSNWFGWATKVLDKHQLPYDIPRLCGDRLRVKNFFSVAINCADMEDLGGLDNLYVTERIEKTG